MQMKLNSRILKDEIQNAYKLENKNPKDLEKQEENMFKTYQKKSREYRILFKTFKRL